MAGILDKNVSEQTNNSVIAEHSAVTKGLKVLFYYPDFGAMGGIERFIHTVAQALKQRGHIEPVIACSPGSPLLTLLREQGIRMHMVWTLPCFAKPALRLMDVISMAQLWRILALEKPDIVHVHIGHWENMLFRFLGYRVVYTVHGYASLYSLQGVSNPLKAFVKKFFRWLYTTMVPHLNAMLFVSQAEQQRMLEEGYLPKGFTGEVVPNGLSIEELQAKAKQVDKAAWRKALCIPKDAVCLSFINRLDSNKNPMVFVELAEQLAKQPGLPPLRFLIAGTGPLSQEVHARVNQSPIHEQIAMLGQREDIIELLASSDLIVHTPKMEGFGLGILEAMAIGTPCLAYATGGIPEILDDPELKDLLVPASDFQALLEKAKTLLNLPLDERQTLSQHLQQRAGDFDISVLVSRLERIYQEIVQKPAPNEPLISVIVPVHQGEASILRAVRSVLNQSYQNLELIVVDDGSTDKTLSRLATVSDPRLTILTQSNQGVAAARNLGIAHAKGEYLAFLDADDVWFPNQLATAMETIRQQPDPVCMVYSSYYGVDDTARLINLPHIYTVAGLARDAVLRWEGLLLPSTTMMHRQVVEAAAGFPTDCYHEDRVFFIRASQQFPMYPTGKRTVIYRQSLSGRCRRVLSNYDQALQAEFSIVDSLKPLFPPEEIDRLMALQTRNLLYRFLMYNFVTSAKQIEPQVQPGLLLKDKKGLLALLSLKTGLNILYSCRIAMQTVVRYTLLPWWHWKIRTIYHSNQ